MQGIVFDLDGTLVDSLLPTFAAFNRAMVEFGGREHSPKEIIGYGDYASLFARFLGPEKGPKALRACLGYYDEMGTVPLHPGVLELLEKIRVEGVAVSIFTGRGRESTALILRSHGLRNHFITVVTSDDVGETKPAPEGLRMATRAMKLKPQDVMLVGDSPLDVLAARACGATSVAALWDAFADRELLEPHEPHHWAQKPGDIWELWTKLQSIPGRRV